MEIKLTEYLSNYSYFPARRLQFILYEAFCHIVLPSKASCCSAKWLHCYGSYYEAHKFNAPSESVHIKHLSQPTRVCYIATSFNSKFVQSRKRPRSYLV